VVEGERRVVTLRVAAVLFGCSRTVVLIRLLFPVLDNSYYRVM